MNQAINPKYNNNLNPAFLSTSGYFFIYDIIFVKQDHYIFYIIMYVTITNLTDHGVMGQALSPYMRAWMGGGSGIRYSLKKLAHYSSH